MDSITLKIRNAENKRLKLPNYSLIKFIFENFVIDLLLFLVLRHHTIVNEALAEEDIVDNLEEGLYKPIKGFSSIMKKFVYDLSSYESASAPYVSNIIDILVKFIVGEEYYLSSDIIDLLEEDSNLRIKENTLDEYFNLVKKSNVLNSRRFFSNPSEDIDLLDKTWSDSVTRKPYCFWSNNWSFYQCTIALSLLRDAFGDAGIGSSSHPVILEYNQFIMETKKKPGFEAESSISYVNSRLKGSTIKTADYFAEIMILSNNIISLEDPNSGTTSLKVIINYVKTVIQSKNVEKVRAVLDSRIMLKCIGFLQSDDVQLKESILELIKEGTNSFTRDHLYLFEKYDVNSKFDSVMDTKLRTADEIQKNFGLVAHLALSTEDKMNKSNYVN